MMYDAFVLETSKSVGMFLLCHHTFDSLCTVSLCRISKNSTSSSLFRPGIKIDFSKY